MHWKRTLKNLTNDVRTWRQNCKSSITTKQILNRIDGVTEKKGETWEQSEEEIQTIFKEKLGLENIKIERARRSKGKTSSNKARTIVCKLLSYKQKKKVLKKTKKLKASNIFIKENFFFETMQRKKELWEEVKRLRSDDQIAFLNTGLSLRERGKIVVINLMHYI